MQAVGSRVTDRTKPASFRPRDSHAQRIAHEEQVTAEEQGTWRKRQNKWPP